MTRGLFISLEGADGVGKSTQVGLLSAWLDELAVSHLVTREPGGTPAGEAIRSVVLAKGELPMPPQAELFLILAARACFVREVVEPALAEGKTVVADRYALSSLAYQGYGRGLDLEAVRSANRTATGGLEPDVYLLFDIAAPEAELRRVSSGAVPDRIEREGAAFRDAVRGGYLEMAGQDPRIETIDATGSPAEVHARVRAALTRRFPDVMSTGDEAGRHEG